MPLRVGLAHTHIKIGRAYTHLEELKEVVIEYGKYAHTITRQDDPWKGVHRAIIEYGIFAPEKAELLRKLAVLPGEFAYCLRSGLDHLAWQLALLTTDTPNGKTCFPIYETPPGPKSRYRESVSDFPPSAASIIESLQPHKRGAAFKDDLLWQLNKLCNIDKHQLIVLGSTAYQVGVRPGVTQAWRRDLDHAIEISVPLAEKEQLQLDVMYSGVVFGEPIDAIDGTSDFEIGIDRFEEIYNFIGNEVVPKFKSLFT